MEESYETFEEELGPPRADPPPQKPVRQIRRPEMYATRKVREEMAPIPQQPRAEPKTLPREPSFPRTTTLRKAMSIQNLTQIERPWENVTLNRCLFVAIAILVLTSGCQRLNEALRGQGTAEEEEEDALTVRRSGTVRHRGHPLEPEITLWEVLFSWMPDLDDEEDEDEDEDGEVKRGKSKRGATAQTSSRLRNKPTPDKTLMKKGGPKLKDRRTKRNRDEEIVDKKERDKTEEPEETADDEGEDQVDEEEEEEPVPMKKKKSGEQEKKKPLKS